jgi:hypothetical protein
MSVLLHALCGARYWHNDVRLMGRSGPYETRRQVLERVQASQHPSEREGGDDSQADDDP